MSQPDKLREEASVWLSRLDRGLQDNEGPALREWLRKPANRKVLMDTARQWHGPDVLALLAELFPSDVEASYTQHPRNVLAMTLSAGAAVCVVAFGAVMLLGHTPSWSSMKEASSALFSRGYATAVGERREVTLDDGSTVTLNTNTRMVVTYGQSSREVNLVSGEATFHVAHGDTRPFSVRAGKRGFQAVGTRFNVRVLSPDDVELTVTEGAVKVLYAPPRLPETPAERRENLSWGETTLTALESARVEPGFQAVRALHPSEVDMRLAWQRGLIIFDSALLEDVLAEVDRYTTSRFVLADEELRRMRIAGHFRAGDIEELRARLREDFHVDSRRDAQGRIVLTALRTP